MLTLALYTQTKCLFFHISVRWIIGLHSQDYARGILDTAGSMSEFYVSAVYQIYFSI